MTGFGPTFGWPEAEEVELWMQRHPQLRLKALVRAFADRVFGEPEPKPSGVYKYHPRHTLVFPPGNWQ